MTCFRDHVHRCQGKIDEIMNAAVAAHGREADIEFWEGIRLYVENRVVYDFEHDDARDAAIHEACEHFGRLLRDVIDDVSREANFHDADGV